MTALPTLLSACAGLALGWVYFRGLRATVDALPRSVHPGRLMLASYLARTALAALVLVAIVRHAGVAGLAAALAGFVAARLLLTRRARLAQRRAASRDGRPPR